MRVTHEEKVKAQTVMIVTYTDGNCVPMFGLVYKSQTKPKITLSERMTIEFMNFEKHISNNRDLIMSAAIYKNNYKAEGRFYQDETRLMREYKNGFWSDTAVPNKAQFASEKAGSSFDL